jgi:hypothetical protein
VECAQQILSFDASMGWDAARRSHRAGALEIDDKHARCALTANQSAAHHGSRIPSRATGTTMPSRYLSTVRYPTLMSAVTGMPGIT